MTDDTQSDSGDEHRDAVEQSADELRMNGVRGVTYTEDGETYRRYETEDGDIVDERVRDGHQEPVLVTDGGEQIETVSADWATAHCPNCEELSREPLEFLPREIKCEGCGEIWRMTR